jgi:hypothetical protein
MSLLERYVPRRARLVTGLMEIANRLLVRPYPRLVEDRLRELVL